MILHLFLGRTTHHGAFKKDNGDPLHDIKSDYIFIYKLWHNALKFSTDKVNTILCLKLN